MRFAVLSSVLSSALALPTSALAADRPAPPRPERQSASPAEAARAARLAWWREARFGMFIHWGLYAVPAGEWKGEPIAGIGEWIMHEAADPGRRVRAAGRRSSTR